MDLCPFSRGFVFGSLFFFAPSSPVAGFLLFVSSFSALMLEMSFSSDRLLLDFLGLLLSLLSIFGASFLAGAVALGAGDAVCMGREADSSSCEDKYIHS